MTAVVNDYTNPVKGNFAGVSTVQFDRPADTDAYAAGDVISNSSIGGFEAVIEFKGVGTSGLIRRVQVVMEESDTVNLELYLFNVEPTNFLDNAALALVAADFSKLIAAIDLDDADKKDVGLGEIYTPSSDDANPFPIPYNTDNGRLYGLLVTRSIYTPSSASQFSVQIGWEAR